ncbi:MAG: FKBP-type peptidyl-prolyl cis-trans isomerase SlyD, partial [uncultured Gemmatimonadetes bacterium]
GYRGRRPERQDGGGVLQGLAAQRPRVRFALLRHAVLVQARCQLGHPGLRRGNHGDEGGRQAPDGHSARAGLRRYGGGKHPGQLHPRLRGDAGVGAV